jgi:integrase
MAIRERTWTSGGKEKTAWVCEYFDSTRKWRLKTFKTKKEAQAFEATVRVDIRHGRHVADSASVTIEEAGKLWIETGEKNGLVESSIRQCRQHLDHIKASPIGSTKLSKLTVPVVRSFEEWLRANGRSPALTKKVLSSLGSIVADAMERGLAAHNPVREMRKVRKNRRTKAARERNKRLEVGVDIPTPAEIRAIIKAANVYRRAFFATAALCGLRASELRGLPWSNVDFAKSVIRVTQRADKWGTIDVPKSEAGEREVPMPPPVVSALREWKLQCARRDTGKKDANGEPIKELHFVFPNGKGHVESHENIVQRHWMPLQIVAGLSVPAPDKGGSPVREPILGEDGKPVIGSDGAPVMREVLCAKYGRKLHSLRHFFCSWCAARPQDGGLGLPLKTVQVRMGHSTLAMTADRYGHLFPSTDDAEVLSAGARALMGA